MSSSEQLQGCPAAEDLQRFLTSELSESDLERIAAHLDACASCRERVDASPELASWGDDVRWATLQREKTPVDVSVPVARLNELLTDYEIVMELGRGGMGIVYQARQLKLNRMVALKVLPALLGVVRPDAVKRFQREAELAAQLKHSNIIAVYDYGEIDGTLYYAMELIEGRSLRDILREIEETKAIDVVLGAGGSTDSPAPAASSEPSAVSKKEEATRQRGSEATDRHGGTEARRHEGDPTSDIGHPTSPALTRLGSSSQADRSYFRRVAGWFADVAEALDYAHEQGVIHRDIKPSNLLLSVDGRMMISDFGLARASSMDTLTASRSLLGTARYMSPEQADESLGAIDRRVDVYGLGATLYELLAFRPMYAAADDREVLNQVLNKEPPPPHRSIRQVPRELETICLKAAEKDREARYGTAKAMADDLRRWLLDLPIHARRPSLLVRVRKYVRRRKVPVALAATSAILFVASAFIYAAYSASYRDATEARSVARSQRVQLLLLEARSDFLEGEYQTGLSKVDEALADQPGLVEARVLRARFLGHLRRHEEEIRVLEGVLADDPDCWAAHYALVTAYKTDDPEKAAYHQEHVERLMPETARADLVRSLVEPDPQRAIELLSKAIEIDSDSVDAFLQRAVRYRQLRQHALMLADAERAAILRPNWAITHGLRGRALLLLGRFHEAVPPFNRAIELEPKWAKWWRNRAWANFQIERYEEAIADANVAISLEPDSANGYVYRGSARMASGDLEGGLTDFGRAIELDPDRPVLYHDRGIGHQRAGLYDKAIADFTRCIELFGPEDDQAHPYLSRAMVYVITEQYPEAIADYTEAFGREPSAPPTEYSNRATAYLRTGQFEQAIADYTRVIQLIDPAYSADAHRGRGSAYLHLGGYDKAVVDLDHAVELAPDDPKMYRTRGSARIWMQRFDGAIADLTQAVELDPSKWAVAMMKRGLSYEMAGSSGAALADYERLANVGGEIGDYATLWKYILLRESGQDEVAADVLSSHSAVKGDRTWTDRLFNLLAGDISPERLLSAVASDAQRCEAWYYVGMQAMLEDRPRDARDALTRCLDLEQWGVVEYLFARARLKQLDERGQPPQVAP